MTVTAQSHFYSCGILWAVTVTFAKCYLGTTLKKKMFDKAIDRIRRERQNFVILSEGTPIVYSSHLHQRAVEEDSWKSLKDDMEHLHLSEMTPDADLTSKLLQAIDAREAKRVLNLCDELNGKLHIAIKQIPF